MLTFSLLVGALLGFILYLVISLKRAYRTHLYQLEYEHERALLLLKELAEDAMESVKATSIKEREQVRATREVNNVQIAQLRDIIKKQAEMITNKTVEPEKVKLSDGTEINPKDYEWNVGI